MSLKIFQFEVIERQAINNHARLGTASLDSERGTGFNNLGSARLLRQEEKFTLEN